MPSRRPEIGQGGIDGIAVLLSSMRNRRLYTTKVAAGMPKPPRDRHDIYAGGNQLAGVRVPQGVTGDLHHEATISRAIEKFSPPQIEL